MHEYAPSPDKTGLQQAYHPFQLMPTSLPLPPFNASITLPPPSPPPPPVGGDNITSFDEPNIFSTSNVAFASVARCHYCCLPCTVDQYLNIEVGADYRNILN